MTNDFALWKSELRRSLEQLSLLARPTGPSQPAELNLGSLFRQAMAELYGTCQFTEFIASQAWRQAGLDEYAGAELLLLQQRLDAFDEPDSDLAFVGNLNWLLIQAQAKRIAALLK